MALYGQYKYGAASLGYGNAYDLAASFLKKLPDVYNKDLSGNIGKLLNVFTSYIVELVSVFNTIHEWRDIDNAQGATLDRIGINLQQPRGSLSDDHYRVLLKATIQSSLSKGDINTIIQVAATMLDVPVTSIKITPIYPASIYMTLPYQLLSENILSNLSLILGFIQNTLAAGIQLQTQITGTFALGAAVSAPEYDSNAGLSDINYSTGGYLGGSIT